VVTFPYLRMYVMLGICCLRDALSNIFSWRP